jgi:hypothetical protein
VIHVTQAGRPWRIGHGRDKLAARARLPGAFAFDCAAHAIRLARLRDLPPIELLPLALGSSWLVNNPVPSPVFRRWLTPPLAASWLALLELVGGAPWSTRGDAERAATFAAASALAVDGHGAGALSKVLALLLPDRVPLMPDAAVAFATGLAQQPRPDAPDAQTAPASVLVPMLDWLDAHVAANAGALERLAEEHGGAPPLDEAQVLDRLLWFDSVGFRHFRTSKAGGGWWPVSDGERSAVVPVSVAPGIELAEGAIDLGRPDLAAGFRDAALRALDG